MSVNTTEGILVYFLMSLFKVITFHWKYFLLWLIICVHLKLYLRSRVIERGKTGIFSVRVHSSNVHNAAAGLGWSQKFHLSPLCGYRITSPLAIFQCFPRCIRWALGSEVEQPQHELVLLWGSGFTSSHLTCCSTTMPWGLLFLNSEVNCFDHWASSVFDVHLIPWW